jgi:hypothetical protein
VRAVYKARRETDCTPRCGAGEAVGSVAKGVGKEVQARKANSEKTDHEVCVRCLTRGARSISDASTLGHSLQIKINRKRPSSRYSPVATAHKLVMPSPSRHVISGFPPCANQTTNIGRLLPAFAFSDAIQLPTRKYRISPPSARYCPYNLVALTAYYLPL